MHIVVTSMCIIVVYLTALLPYIYVLLTADGLFAQHNKTYKIIYYLPLHTSIFYMKNYVFHQRVFFEKSHFLITVPKQEF